MPRKFLDVYNLPEEQATVDGIACEDDSLTSQEFEAECDINRIMSRYEKTGLVPTDGGPVRFDDVSDAPSYQEALNLILDAEHKFDSLPATVRERFGNDPLKLLEFVSEERNADEAESLGLLSSDAVARRARAREELEARASSGSAPGGPPAAVAGPPGG